MKGHSVKIKVAKLPLHQKRIVLKMRMRIAMKFQCGVISHHGVGRHLHADIKRISIDNRGIRSRYHNSEQSVVDLNYPFPGVIVPE